MTLARLAEEACPSPHLGKKLIQLCLRDIMIEVSDVERSVVRWRRDSGYRRSGRHRRGCLQDSGHRGGGRQILMQQLTWQPQSNRYTDEQPTRSRASGSTSAFFSGFCAAWRPSSCNFFWETVFFFFVSKGPAQQCARARGVGRSVTARSRRRRRCRLGAAAAHSAWWEGHPRATPGAHAGVYWCRLVCGAGERGLRHGPARRPMCVCGVCGGMGPLRRRRRRRRRRRGPAWRGGYEPKIF